MESRSSGIYLWRRAGHERAGARPFSHAAGRRAAEDRRVSEHSP